MVVIAALVGVAFVFLGLAVTSAAVNLIGRRDESRFRQDNIIMLDTTRQVLISPQTHVFRLQGLISLDRRASRTRDESSSREPSKGGYCC